MLSRRYRGSENWLVVLRGGLAAWSHLLPYAFAVCVAGRWLLSGAFGLPAFSESVGWDQLLEVAKHLAVGLVVGLATVLVTSLAYGLDVNLSYGRVGGLAVGPKAGLAGGLAGGFPLGLALGLASALSLGLANGLSLGLAFGLAFALAGGLLSNLAFEIIGGLAAGLAGGLLGGVAAGLACPTGFLRLYYQPLHWLLVWVRSSHLFRRWHPVFWDQNCRLPFPGLDQLLVRYAEEDPTDGIRQIERLISDYPSQRAQALRAKTILAARTSAKVASLGELDTISGALPEGEKGYLAQVPKVRERLLAISRLQRHVDTVNRPFFREQALGNLRAEINAFYVQVGGYREPLVSEFRKAAEAWLKLADAQLAEVGQQRRREPTPQVFRAGDPVRRDAEAFVARLEVYGALENEILAGPGCPGLLLYGRRRLGKSTILRNLEGFLPGKVVPVVVSMQNPAALQSESSLAALMGEELVRAWPEAQGLATSPTDLMSLFQFLTAANERLESGGRRVVLALDEFEELDRRIGLGHFTENLAATLRESVQSHRGITWLFAGSHHFSELPNLRWSSYLVSLRTIELPPFTPEETRLLLSQPLKHARGESAKAAAAIFGGGFWGEGGMDRIHEEAGGWPHLVQLIASTVVDLCNMPGKERPDAGMLEEAYSKAVVSGDSVLAELMLYRSEEYPAAWSYLSAFRKQDTQPPPEDDALRLTLKRHLLVKEARDGQWQLRVPLMQRWLRERM